MNRNNENTDAADAAEYSKIENHIMLSKSIYELDMKGRHIINEFNLKKSIGKKRNGSFIFNESMTIIYNNLIHCLSLKRLKMYFCLQYFLDEVMYHEVTKTNKFYIEDSEYNISQIYFGQDDWIYDVMIQHFQFDEKKVQDTTDENISAGLNIHEAMYLICYLKDFDHCLLHIEDYIKPFKTIPKIKSKLRYTFHRIRVRHNYIWPLLLSIINENI
jgi:hypothetical protein